jgi:hypothetical protein
VLARLWFLPTGGGWQISNRGGGYPMWSHNGRELFFETLYNHIMVVAYAVKGDSFVADKPQMWSEKQLGGLVNISRNVDLAPDGKRIVASVPVETAEAQKAQSHVNLPRQLLRRSSAARAHRNEVNPACSEPC